jgi:hypothetical protein
VKKGPLAVAIVAVLIVAVLAGSWVLDNRHANEVRVVVRLALKSVPADNTTWEHGTITLLEADGKPRVHDLLEFADYSFDTGGTLAPYEAYTDARGTVPFKFLPAQANPFVLTKSALILVTDQSLGSLLEYDKNFHITIETFDPAAQGKKLHG